MKSVAIVIILFLGLAVLSIGGAYLLTRDTIELGDKVAVIEVRGIISSAQSDGLFEIEGATPERIRDQIEKAERDSSVKAILIEVNSPGGTIVASEAIAEAIGEAEKPTVAWLGEIAASGGYYVASASDRLYCCRQGEYDGQHRGYIHLPPIRPAPRQDRGQDEGDKGR